MAEAGVVAEHHAAGAHPQTHDPMDELLGGHFFELGVEGQDGGEAEAAAPEQEQAVGQRRDAPRAAGADHGFGQGVEGDGHGLSAGLPRPGDGGGQDALVPEVYPVECPDRDHRRPQRRQRREESVHEVHGGRSLDRWLGPHSIIHEMGRCGKGA